MELARWRRAGRRARLWWRDDDARAVTPPLERLLAIGERTGIPLTLAVIPTGDMAGLAARLGSAAQTDVAQHGVDHQNRRTGPQAGEFPHDWPSARVDAALRRGWGEISRLPGAVAAYVPPWNDVHPDLEAVLADCGFVGWSANGALAGEGLADHQLAAFKATPANRGLICDSGLWAWSRHPNYFFEWLGWCAWPLFAIDFGGVSQFDFIITHATW